MSQSVEFKYELGVKAKDRVSGIEGILDMRAEYLNGCIRYSIQPKILKSKPAEIPGSYWVDENQIELISKGLNKKPVKKSATGGPTESSSSARM